MDRQLTKQKGSTFDTGIVLFVRDTINGVDGIYGSGTAAAVKQFQKAEELTVNGIAGQNTMYELYK